jgi:hypothetical protein
LVRKEIANLKKKIILEEGVAVNRIGSINYFRYDIQMTFNG